MKEAVKSAFYLAQRAYGRGRMASGLSRPDPNRLAVFLLHAVSDIDSEMAVSPERLRQQFQALLDRGFQCVAIDEVVQHLTAGTQPAIPSFAITFDDGYLNNFTEGLPVLADLGLSATVFVTVGLIEGEARPPWRSDDPGLTAHYAQYGQAFAPMTWDDVRSLADSGQVTIGSHTLSHPLVGLLEPDVMRDEVVRSREILEAQLGREVLDFSYPFGVAQYGAYSDDSEDLVGSAGYRCSFSAEIGRPRWSDGPRLIPRISLTNEDEPADAVAKACGAYDWVGFAQRSFQRVVPNPHLAKGDTDRPPRSGATEGTG